MLWEDSLHHQNAGGFAFEDKLFVGFCLGEWIPGVLWWECVKSFECPHGSWSVLKASLSKKRTGSPVGTAIVRVKKFCFGHQSPTRCRGAYPLTEWPCFWLHIPGNPLKAQWWAEVHLWHPAVNRHMAMAHGGQPQAVRMPRQHRAWPSQVRFSKIGEPPFGVSRDACTIAWGF